MKARHLFFAYLAIAMLQGCVIIPTLEHHTDEYNTRGIIDEETISFMKPRFTSKEEVLLKLGEPEYVWNNGLKFVYHWKVTRGFLIYGAGYTGGINSLGKDYILLIHFDQDDQLLRFEIKSDEFSDELKQW